MAPPSNKKSLAISLLAELSDRMGDHKADLREMHIRHRHLAQRVNALETWRVSQDAPMVQLTATPPATDLPRRIETAIQTVLKWMPLLRLMAKGGLWMAVRAGMIWGTLSGTFLNWLGQAWRLLRLLAASS